MKLSEIDPVETEVTAIEAWRPPTERQREEHLASVENLLMELHRTIDPHVPLALNLPCNVGMGRVLAAFGIIANDARMLAEQKGCEFGAVEVLALGVFYAPILTEAYVAEANLATKQLAELEKLRGSAN